LKVLCAVLSVASVLLPAAAWSQTDLIVVAQREALCLVHEDGVAAMPAYPPEMFKRKEGGSVPTTLTFRGPDERPTVEVDAAVELRIDPRLVDAVRVHARGLRVPCMPRDAAPVSLKRTFQFIHDGRRVFASAPIDKQERVRAETLKCLTNAVPAPEYPIEARRQGWEGTVPVKLTFQPDKEEPSFELMIRPRGRGVEGALTAHARGHRLPCLTKNFTNKAA
jgi:hypothetical protein